MNELTNKTTNTQILNWYKNAPDTDCIYGYMYGQPTILVHTLTGLVEKPDEIVSIKKRSLYLSKDEDCFIYIWGMPGPDANFYEFKDYGVTWAFTKDELCFATNPTK